MARSVHTRPRHLLAADRVRAPRTPRGARDPSAARRVARLLKVAGILTEQPLEDRQVAAPLPRIVQKWSRTGRHHPANKIDIRRVLRFFGETCCYGLRSVELVGRPDDSPGGRLAFGRLAVPGRVLLFDQPPAPWFIPGQLPPRQLERLARAGAVVERSGDGLRTVIWWPGDTLRDFMLFDVMMHEIGHHLIQQYKGKRTVRVVRTKDAEAFADRFALRCRAAMAREGKAIA